MSDPEGPGQTPILVPPSPSKRNGLPSIAQARFVQDALVVAYLQANFIDDSGTMTTLQITQRLPVNQQGVANLVPAGVPNGTMVNFSSYVVAVGGYPNNQWFRVDDSSGQGAEFEQKGTAFKGWFTYTGLYKT